MCIRDSRQGADSPRDLGPRHGQNDRVRPNSIIPHREVAVRTDAGQVRKGHPERCVDLRLCWPRDLGHDL
eukprot:9265946-Alexandrium_andersonii.AAC.1